MFIQKLAGRATAAAILIFAPIGASQASMYPTINAPSSVQRVDCAVGFHIGPAGACIIGTDDTTTHTTVVEHRDVERRDDCATKTVKKTNGEGDSMTKTTTTCD